MEWRHTVWPEIRMVYTATPKVANTSVKGALLESFRPGVPRRNPHDEGLPYVQVRPGSIAQRHPGFLHFAVVRDPFDRFVSFFEDRVVGTGFGDRMRRLGFDPAMSLTEAARLAATIPDRRGDPHMRSQAFLLTDRRGRLRPHLVLRFERLSQDWHLLSVVAQEIAGRKPTALPHRRVSDRRGCACYYDDEARRLVVQRYRRDFTVLGYPTSPGAQAGQGGSGQSGSGQHDDPARPALDAALANGARGVLDLSTGSLSRALAVEEWGGYYLGLAKGSSVGQLTDGGPLENGSLPDSLFDVLVMPGRRSRPFGSYRWLRSRFESTGRTVITV